MSKMMWKNCCRRNCSINIFISIIWFHFQLFWGNIYFYSIIIYINKDRCSLNAIDAALLTGNWSNWDVSESIKRSKRSWNLLIEIKSFLNIKLCNLCCTRLSLHGHSYFYVLQKKGQIVVFIIIDLISLLHMGIMIQNRFVGLLSGGS